MMPTKESIESKTRMKIQSEKVGVVLTLDVVELEWIDDIGV
jgi:hypothetical protein